MLTIGIAQSQWVWHAAGMKYCDDCKWAEWKRTANGRLHPDKTGRCVFEIKIPVLPLAFRWGFGQMWPIIGGGYIERKRELRDHCPTWTQKDSMKYVVGLFKKVEIV